MPNPHPSVADASALLDLFAVYINISAISLIRSGPIQAASSAAIHLIVPGSEMSSSSHPTRSYCQR